MTPKLTSSRVMKLHSCCRVPPGETTLKRTGCVLAFSRMADAMEYGESRFLEDVNARRRNLEWYYVNISVIHFISLEMFGVMEVVSL